jgi:hypothetical protein
MKRILTVIVVSIALTAGLLAISSMSGTALGVGGRGAGVPSGGKGSHTTCNGTTCITSGGGGCTISSGSGQGGGGGGQTLLCGKGCHIQIHGGSDGSRP